MIVRYILPVKFFRTCQCHLWCAVRARNVSNVAYLCELCAQSDRVRFCACVCVYVPYLSQEPLNVVDLGTTSCAQYYVRLRSHCACARVFCLRMPTHIRACITAQNTLPEHAHMNYTHAHIGASYVTISVAAHWRISESTLLRCRIACLI